MDPPSYLGAFNHRIDARFAEPGDLSLTKVHPDSSTKHGSGPFIFVTSTNAKPDAASRRSIRSHVMRGRNRKRPPEKAGVKAGFWFNNTDTAPSEPQCGRPMRIPRSIGSDLTLFPFAEDLTPPMLNLVFQCMSSKLPNWFVNNRSANVGTHSSTTQSLLQSSRACTRPSFASTLTSRNGSSILQPMQFISIPPYSQPRVSLISHARVHSGPRR